MPLFFIENKPVIKIWYRGVKMERKHKLGIRIMIILSIALFVLLGCMIILQFSNSKESVHTTLGNNAVIIAKNISTYIDEDKMKAFIENPVEGVLYTEIREELNDLREKNGVLYVYTLAVPTDDKLTFLVDGMPLAETDDVGGIGDASTSPIEQIRLAAEKGSAFTDIEVTKFGEFISGFIPLTDKSGEIYAYLGIDIDANLVNDISNDVAQSAMLKTISIFILLIILGLGSTYAFINRALRPLNILMASVDELAKGDIEKAKELSESINLKQKNEITVFTKGYNDSLNSLSTTFERIHNRTSEWKDAIAVIQKMSMKVQESNTYISNSAKELADGSNSQSRSNEEVVIAMNEMTVGIQNLADTTSDIVDSSFEMKALVEKSVTNAQRVMQQISSMEESVVTTSQHVKEMTERSHAIGEMVSIITGIADQTNLLALNAAIEAARAGEAGKGFAVVADEVRKLAEMSRSSANDISEHLQSFLIITERALNEMNSSANDVKEGNQAVSAIGDQLEQIELSVKVVNDKILNDSAIIEEMSASSEEILASTEDMNQLVKHNADETTAVAKETEQQVRLVHELSEVVHILEATSKAVIEDIERFKI